MEQAQEIESPSSGAGKELIGQLLENKGDLGLEGKDEERYFDLSGENVCFMTLRCAWICSANA
jgi:hypothetical protein